MGRYFVVVFYSPWFRNEGLKGVRRVFSEKLGYRFLNDTEKGCWWEKGSKMATFIGLVNWKFLYRRVFVEQIAQDKVKFTYYFSWLTNVGVLMSAAREELGYLQRVFQAEKMEVERLR
ncbi:hypothetical protein THYS13_18250 [Thermoanaerobacter sp. YS13]|uniref:hypothetical protein n=1 Tax=Thermoanaerobacter sp. YS13 TaxID=1511746 RepID=UPI0005745411|nr:hypothetical protein [Thermoanaerobacter sp. YS13]KHO61417.1 hypothetical protein THYS13_18250 [Thermoanaerobacter sp. YS13]